MTNPTAAAPSAARGREIARIMNPCNRHVLLAATTFQLAVTFIVILALALVAYWLAMWYAPKVGIDTQRGLPGSQRPLVWLMLTATVAVTIVVVWAFAAGHAAVGIVVLVVFLCYPSLYLFPGGYDAYDDERQKRGSRATRAIDRASDTAMIRLGTR